MISPKPENNPPLPLQDRQLLETIGYTALHKTRKNLISRDKKQLIRTILK
jgi:hypothetical protein